jgi:hypothetical protein
MEITDGVKSSWQLGRRKISMAKQDANNGPGPETRATNETETVRSIADRFCVLVSSSDRGRDIFEIVFQNAETMWRNCDWPRYVGFTSAHPEMYGFKALAATVSSDWRNEVGDYLDALPENVDYVLRIDEDALFMSPVDGEKLNRIAELMVRDDLSYVRLIPVSRNLPGRIIEFLRSKLDKNPLRRLSPSEPYYSSVGLAIWKRSYLRSLLRQQGTIWEFEHIVTSKPHYAVWEPLLDQDQIVVKGRWSRRAARQLARKGLSLTNSKREFQTWGSWLRGIRERISFEIAGYSSFRIRKRLNRLRVYR